jgi:hypothetical protein
MAEIALPLRKYHEDMGPVVWWKFPITEASYIGSPLDSDCPGYHTHFTPHPPIPTPELPNRQKKKRARAEGRCHA